MVYSLGGPVLPAAAKLTQGLRLHFRPERTTQIWCSPCDIGQVLVYMLKDLLTTVIWLLLTSSAKCLRASARLFLAAASCPRLRWSCDRSHGSQSGNLSTDHCAWERYWSASVRRPNPWQVCMCVCVCVHSTGYTPTSLDCLLIINELLTWTTHNEHYTAMLGTASARQPISSAKQDGFQQLYMLLNASYTDRWQPQQG